MTRNLKIIFDTPRLYLRELGPGDAEFAFALNADPDVVKYTGDGPFESVASTREFLAAYDHYRVYGFGRWGMVLKENDTLIGWCGLKYTPDLDEYDIGYRLFKKHWGQGFATEAAAPCISLGFERFGMPAIVGRAARENTGSIRVLEKIGLNYWKDELLHGQASVIYRITR